jgi:hypothetical protein
MILLEDKRYNKSKIINDLTYIPHKGDKFIYNGKDTTIKGVVCSVEYKVVGGENHNNEYITITVY